MTIDRYWMHSASSSDELGTDVARAMARAKSRDWASGSPVAQTNDLRAYLAYSAAIGSQFSGNDELTTAAEVAKGIFRVDPRPAASGEPIRTELARLLIRTPALLWAMVSRDGVPEPGAFAVLRTQHDPEEVGILPLVGIVAVAVASVGVSAAISYVAFQAAQVVDRYLARDEQTERLVEVDARLLELASNHAQREQEAKRSLPLDAATRQAMAQLAAVQNAIVQREPELKSGIEKLGTGSGGLFGGFSLGLVAAALLAVWLLK